MKRARFTEDQIIGVLREHEAGAKTADLARKHGVSEATLYNWKAKFGGMDVSEAKRLRQLEDENAKLKRLLADAMLDNAALKDLVTKNSDARRQARGCRPSRIRLRDERAPGVPPDKGRSQDRPLPIASTARRRLARPLAGTGCRAAPVRLSPLHILLRAEGHVLNRKKTQQLYREEGLTVRKRKGRKRATGMRAPILVEARPNARWSVDFVHDQLSNGRRFRILNVIDDVTKECAGNSMASSSAEPAMRCSTVR